MRNFKNWFLFLPMLFLLYTIVQSTSHADFFKISFVSAPSLKNSYNQEINTLSAIANNAVVTVYGSFFGQVGVKAKRGTGFIIDPNGYVLTVRHVLDGYSSFTVTLADGSQYPANVVFLEPSSDLAVLKIPGNNFSSLQLGDSSLLAPGQVVVGVAPGIFPLSVAAGQVSGRNTISERDPQRAGRSFYGKSHTVQRAVLPGLFRRPFAGHARPSGRNKCCRCRDPAERQLLYSH